MGWDCRNPGAAWRRQGIRLRPNGIKEYKGKLPQTTQEEVLAWAPKVVARIPLHRQQKALEVSRNLLISDTLKHFAKAPFASLPSHASKPMTA
jgi:hypothetical protein